MFYASVALHRSENPNDFQGEQRSLYNVCQLAGEDTALCYTAHQPCNNTVPTFPLTFVREAKYKSLMRFYSSTRGSKSPGLILLGMSCLQSEIMSNKQKKKMFLLDLKPFIVSRQLDRVIT